MGGQQKAVDRKNKIKAARRRYECRDCGREFEYLFQAEDHHQMKGGGQAGQHEWTVVERE